MWGVRKACAEVFMGVSCACSLPTRKNKLSPLFVSLLTDQSRWVGEEEGGGGGKGEGRWVGLGREEGERGGKEG